MTTKKSRVYNTDEGNASFSFIDKKLIGASLKNSVNMLVPVDNTSTTFNTLIQSDEALDAFNKAVYGPNKEGYKNFIDFATIEEMTQHYTNEKKKSDNASFIEESFSSEAIAFANYANSPTTKNRYGSVTLNS